MEVKNQITPRRIQTSLPQHLNPATKPHGLHITDDITARAAQNLFWLQANQKLAERSHRLSIIAKRDLLSSTLNNLSYQSQLVL